MANYYDPNTAEYFDPATTRKVAVVTGGAGGLGWYTILHLYLHGYVVYMAARNPAKVEKAIADIKEEAAKRASDHPTGEIHHVEMDLLLLQLVKEAAETLAKTEPKIDILINNAGIMAVPYEITKDGYEIQYQVNFVGHLLLTTKLLPNLEAAPAPRVVMLSLMGHKAAFKYFDPSDTINKWPDAAWTWVRYGVVKAAEIQYAKYMAVQHPRILWISVHPGIVPGTNLFDPWKQAPLLGPIVGASTRFLDSTVGVTNEQGLYSTLRAALDPTLLPAKDNGKYLNTGGSEATPTLVASDANNAKRTVEYNLEQLKAKGFL